MFRYRSYKVLVKSRDWLASRMKLNPELIINGQSTFVDVKVIWRFLMGVFVAEPNDFFFLQPGHRRTEFDEFARRDIL